MTDEEKLMCLFTEVHGEMTGACRAEIIYDDNGMPTEVACVKDGNICWSSSREELVFAYVTKDFDQLFS